MLLLLLCGLVKSFKIVKTREKDKLELFKVLMTSRMGWTPESVQAMNILDIVFSDDKKVRAAWKAYYDRLCTDDPQNPTQQELKHIQEAQYELLETMANSLGYKDKDSRLNYRSNF